ncbi:hypothetical protein L1D14_10535 [Vibrio tubiashii]|uniref:hypothetical protein n=1 Tax=Vibrio tubiashii TaxID=29498 RepID=UPI001EFD2E6F|nr:hypothetical protein [Vibrio tubiashii]MCG9576674.1 hypothetical protein [Vibrio tubiashii]
MAERTHWMHFRVSLTSETAPTLNFFQTELIDQFWALLSKQCSLTSLSTKWSTVRVTPDGYSIDLTIDSAQETLARNRATKIAELFASTFNLPTIPKTTNVSTQYLSGANAIRTKWSCLQVSFSTEIHGVAFPKISTETANKVLDTLCELVGQEVIVREWTFSSTFDNSLSFNMPIPEVYSPLAIELFTKSVQENLLALIKPNKIAMTLSVNLVPFVPHMYAKPFSVDSSSAIRYTVTNFTYAVSKNDVPIDPSSMETIVLEDIVRQNLLRAAVPLGYSSKALDPQNFRAVLFDYEPDSIKVEKIDDERYACCCTMSFSMNMDVVGPFFFGLEDAALVCPPEIVQRVPCKSNHQQGMLYNWGAFGDILNLRVSNFGHDYVSHQSQLVVYHSRAASMDALALLCKRVSDFLEQSAVNDFFPIGCFQLSPHIDKDNEEYSFNLGFANNDSTLIRELLFALNEMRLNDPDLIQTTDSFPVPVAAT